MCIKRQHGMLHSCILLHHYHILNMLLKVDVVLAVFILTNTLCCDTMPYSLGSNSLPA